MTGDHDIFDNNESSSFAVHLRLILRVYGTAASKICISSPEVLWTAKKRMVREHDQGNSYIDMCAATRVAGVVGDRSKKCFLFVYESFHSK